FQAAVTDVFDAYGAVLDSLPEVEDPAETFARSFRLAGRFFRLRPQECRVLLNVGIGPILSDRGLAPRALRDIIAANRAGRFHVADPQLALAMAAGTLLALGQVLQDQPERDDAQASDRPDDRRPAVHLRSTGRAGPRDLPPTPPRHCQHHRGRVGGMTANSSPSVVG